MFDDRLCNGFCFQGISACFTTIINGIRQMVETQTEALFRAGAWEDDELIFVELVIGQTDQRLVAAAIMPAEHPAGCALTVAHAENALHISGDIFFFLD